MIDLFLNDKKKIKLGIKRIKNDCFKLEYSLMCCHQLFKIPTFNFILG